jgi:hypothetical protein
MNETPRAVVWDDGFWVDGPMAGSAAYVSENKPDDVPVLLVPDRERGGFKEHHVGRPPRGRLGF